MATELMNGNLHRLERSLLLAQACLNGHMGASTLGVNDDPLRLDLPPLLNGEDGITPSALALRAMAAIYLQAELEQTGIIVVAEGMAQLRTSLGLRSARAAEKVERFAQRQHDWYDQNQRNELFARLFGMGDASMRGRGLMANHDFQQRVAALCLSMTQYSEDYRWGQQPGPTREAALRHAARMVLFNLGPRQYGNTLIAGRTIQEQLQAAIDILNDPDVGALFMGRGLWDTLRKILGSKAPDIGRFANRGQSGQRLLTWLALVLPELKETAPTQALLPANSPAFVWAAAWLNASGLAVRSARAVG